MVELRLVLAKRPGRAIVRVPLLTRLVFALTSLASLAGAFGSSGAVYGLPLALALVCALAAMYEESWRFTPADNLIEFRFGLVFLCRKKRWALDSLEALELSESSRYCLLSLKFAGGKVVGLETVSRRNGPRLKETAAWLAELCGKPLVEDQTAALPTLNRI